MAANTCSKYSTHGSVFLSLTWDERVSKTAVNRIKDNISRDMLNIWYLSLLKSKTFAPQKHYMWSSGISSLYPS